MQARTSTPVAIAGAAIGHVLEWYDFGVYAYFALQISEFLFPSGAPGVALLSTFLVFGIGFVIRPLGSIVFAHYGDTHGRKNALLITFWIMGFATMLTGLIPPYSSIGILAPALLIVFRLAQGFGGGGEWGGVGSYLTELGGKNRRGLYGSMQQVFILVSLLAGSLTGLALTSIGTSFVNTIGWRLPFVIGGLVMLPITAVLRTKLPETESFVEVKQKGEIVRFPIVQAFTKDLKPTLLILFGTVIWTVSFYIMLSYLPTYIKTTTSLSLNDSFIITSAGILLIAIFVPVWAYLSDRKFGRKKLALVGAVGFIILPYPVFVVIHSGSFYTVLAATLLLDFFISFLSAVNVSWFAESFPTVDRYSGFIPYNISTSIFGGFAAYIAIFLINSTGDPIAPVYYVIASGVLSAIAYAFMKETAKIEKLPGLHSVYSKQRD